MHRCKSKKVTANDVRVKNVTLVIRTIKFKDQPQMIHN